MAKDERLYARFDIAMDEHPKVLLLSDAAFRTLFEVTFYSRRQLTDGFLAAGVVKRRWDADAIAELQNNDPSRPSLYPTEKDGVTGLMIHDYEKHQTTTADINSKREAGRMGGMAKAKRAASKPLHPGSDPLEQNGSKPLAKTETETETETLAVVTLSDAEAPDPDEDFGLIEEDWQPEPKNIYPADFTAFWDVYPRRGGKGAAMTAFTKAKKRAPFNRIIDGAQSLANDPNLPADKSLIPMPATWLNQDRWEDDPLPARGEPDAHLTSSERRMAANLQQLRSYGPTPDYGNPFAQKALDR